MTPPPGQRTPAEWRQISEANLGVWWAEWEKVLRRHDRLTPTVASGDNLAFLARQTGLGRQRLLAKALVDADMWDRQVLVLCPPAVRLHWHTELCQAGFAAHRVTAASAWQASRGDLRAQFALFRQISEADVLVIEPPVRPKTKLFASLAKQVREASHSTQIITTGTLVWGAELSPPRFADSCLKLLGYLDAREDIHVCWAEDCYTGRVNV